MPIGTQSDGVLELRLVTFAYREDAQHVKHYGLIAEEVAAVYLELVTRTAEGEVQTVKYHELIPMLLNELQHERQALQEERAEVASLRQELVELRASWDRGRDSKRLGARHPRAQLLARASRVDSAPHDLA